MTPDTQTWDFFSDSLIIRDGIRCWRLYQLVCYGDGCFTRPLRLSVWCLMLCSMSRVSALLSPHSLPAPAPADMTVRSHLISDSSIVDKMRNSPSQIRSDEFRIEIERRSATNYSRQLWLQQNCNEHVSLSCGSVSSLVTASANERPEWGAAGQWEASIAGAGQGPLEPIIPCILLNICHSRDLLSPATICPETKLWKQQRISSWRD